MGNKDLEMEVKQPDKDSPASPDEADKPPEPPKRDNKSEIPPEMVSEPKPKRRTIGSFPRPEVIYKPEKSESCMTCLRNTLVIINIIIWLFGAALMGLGIWVKVDRDFWELQTGLDMNQFTQVAYIMIVAGLCILLFAMVGCCGAFQQKMWMLVTYSIIVIIIILLEITVIAMVWTVTNSNNTQMEMSRLTRKAMQEMAEKDRQRYFLALVQSKLQCCGLNGPDDYEGGPIPRSCINTDTGYPYKKGCGNVIVDYFKSKASIFGGVAVAVFVFQLAALIATLCMACGLKQSSADSVF